ncbi:MAG: NtrC-family two-component system sensor histidine kinase KinB [Cellvibrionaceae bacterium]|jgi:NtrC-family two-component system sensor histidine kinase KinB
MLRTTSDLQKKSDSHHLRVLFRVSSVLSQVTAGLDLERILPEVLRTCIGALKTDTGSLFVLDREYKLQHAHMFDSKKGFGSANKDHLQQIMDTGLASKVIQTGDPILISDTNDDERWLSQGTESTVSMSAMCIPLKAYGRVMGTITLIKNGIDQFGEQDLSLILVISEQISTSISNAQLYAESQRQAESLHVLVNAASQISSSLDVSHVIQLVAEHIVRLINIETCTLLELDKGTGELIGQTMYMRDDQAIMMPKQDQLRINNAALVKDLLANPRFVQMNIENSQLERPELYLLQRLGLSTMLIMPLMAPSGILGIALLMDRSSVRSFYDEEVSIIRTLCNQAAVSIHNARSYEETQRQLNVTTLLNETSKVINSSLDLEQIMQSLLEQTNSFLQVEALSIALVDSVTNELVYTVSNGIGSEQIIGMRMPSTEGVSGWVVEHKAPAMVNDTHNDPRFIATGDRRTGHQTSATIVAPLQIKGQVLGTIQAINPTTRSYFTTEDLNLLVNLANLASSAISNAQQFTRTQKAEARYIGLFQDSIDPIILTDRTGYVIEANSRACELFGLSRLDMLVKHINDLHIVDTGVMGERQFKPIKTRQIKMFTSEVVSKETSKKTVVEVYAKRLFVNSDDRAADRQVLQWIYHDISETIELQNMREDLTAMLFHDLQSPLANIIASLELVSEDLPDTSSSLIVNMMDVAIRSSQRLRRLIRSLLDINRLEAGHTLQNQSFSSIARLIDDAEESLRASFDRRNVRLARKLPIFIPDIYIDSDMVRRVIINLLDNGLKYSSDGHLITIIVKENDANNGLDISVQDQGPGIAEEFREVIFDKFRRIKDGDGRKGVGLGLAFCRLAVEAHGGEIWVDSPEEGGARFNFLLPIMPKN